MNVYVKTAASLILGSLFLNCSRHPESNEQQNIPVAEVSLDSANLQPEPIVVESFLKRPPSKIRYPLNRKTIKVLSLHSINSYFLFDGEEHGLEFELLQLYANHSDLDIDIVTVENYKQM